MYTCIPGRSGSVRTDTGSGPAQKLPLRGALAQHLRQPAKGPTVPSHAHAQNMDHYRMQLSL